MEGTKKIKSTSFHQYSWNSEVETTWISLIGWYHKTSSVYWHDYILTVTACLAPDFLCGDGVCLDSSKICDGLMDCSDGTDESNDQCNGKKHLCNQATVWIEQ